MAVIILSLILITFDIFFSGRFQGLKHVLTVLASLGALSIQESGESGEACAGLGTMPTLNPFECVALGCATKIGS